MHRYLGKGLRCDVLGLEKFSKTKFVSFFGVRSCWNVNTSGLVHCLPGQILISKSKHPNVPVHQYWCWVSCIVVMKLFWIQCSVYTINSSCLKISSKLCIHYLKDATIASSSPVEYLGVPFDLDQWLRYSSHIMNCAFLIPRPQQHHSQSKLWVVIISYKQFVQLHDLQNQGHHKHLINTLEFSLTLLRPHKRGISLFQVVETTRVFTFDYWIQGYLGRRIQGNWSTSNLLQPHSGPDWSFGSLCWPLILS